MATYKQMYFKLFHATEIAMDLLLAAQHDCEEYEVPQPALPVKRNRTRHCAAHVRSKVFLHKK